MFPTLRPFDSNWRGVVAVSSHDTRHDAGHLRQALGLEFDARLIFERGVLPPGMISDQIIRDRPKQAQGRPSI